MADEQPLDSAELFRRHAPFVAKFLLRMGAPRADLDDLMQEVFLIAHRGGGYQPGPAKPTTYLASIAFKLVHTERRKRRVRAFVESDDERVSRAKGDGNPEETAAHRQHLRQLQVALDTLDDDKRAVFVLAELQGESIVSIAAGLGIPTDTAHSRLRAARRLFREAVDRGGDDAPTGPMRTRAQAMPMTRENTSISDDSPEVRALLRAGISEEVDYDFEKGLSTHLAAIGAMPMAPHPQRAPGASAAGTAPSGRGGDLGQGSHRPRRHSARVRLGRRGSVARFERQTRCFRTAIGAGSAEERGRAAAPLRPGHVALADTSGSEVGSGPVGEGSSRCT